MFRVRCLETGLYATIYCPCSESNADYTVVSPVASSLYWLSYSWKVRGMGMRPSLSEWTWWKQQSQDLVCVLLPVKTSRKLHYSSSDRHLQQVANKRLGVCVHLWISAEEVKWLHLLLQRQVIENSDIVRTVAYAWGNGVTASPCRITKLNCKHYLYVLLTSSNWCRIPCLRSSLCFITHRFFSILFRWNNTYR
jgi:hypothetical protein